MSERTFKVSGWKAQGRPSETAELKASRQLVREVVFCLARRKRELLVPLQMPTQPISLGEIYLEIRSRVALLRNCSRWPYHVHGKRWWDRCVNECACPTYYEDGIPKIVAVTAGKYEPNPMLFEKEVPA